LIEERDALATIARAALERLHFDPESMQDKEPDCVKACYQCCSHITINVTSPFGSAPGQDFLVQLIQSTTQQHTQGGRMKTIISGCTQ